VTGVYEWVILFQNKSCFYLTVLWVHSSTCYRSRILNIVINMLIVYGCESFFFPIKITSTVAENSRHLHCKPVRRSCFDNYGDFLVTLSRYALLSATSTVNHFLTVSWILLCSSPVPLFISLGNSHDVGSIPFVFLLHLLTSFVYM